MRDYLTLVLASIVVATSASAQALTRLRAYPTPGSISDGCSTMQVGVSGASAAGDYDGDGRGDYLVQSASLPPVLVDPWCYPSTPHWEPYWGVFSGATGSLLLHVPRTPIGDPYFTPFVVAAFGVGDMNGDGFDDVWLRGWPDSAVRAGPDGRTLFTAADRFRAAHGDVDADGHDDVVTSDWPVTELRVRGGPDGRVIRSILPPAARTSFGWGVALVDVDRDGFSDIVVSDPSPTAAGIDQVWVFAGRNGSVLHSLQVAGEVVTGVRDFDGDGYDDFSVSTWYDISVFSGRTGGVLWQQASMLRFGGRSFELAGDVDGDGHDDYVVDRTLVISGRNRATIYAAPTDTKVVPAGNVDTDPRHELLAWRWGSGGAELAALQTATPITSGREWAYGRGCNGADQHRRRIDFRGQADVGSTLMLALRGARASSPVVLHFGDAATLPLDAIGAAGCSLYSIPFVALAATTSAGGAAFLELRFTAETVPPGFRFDLQWAMLDPLANALGVTLSDALAVEVGVRQ